MQIGDELAFSGRDLARLRNSHRLMAGGTEAIVKEWSDSRIVVYMPVVDPGPTQLELRPVTASGEVIPAGTIVLESQHLPTPQEQYIPGAVRVRIKEGASPDDVFNEGDRWNVILPSRDGALGRWLRVEVPVGAEVERISAYAASPQVEFAEFEPVLVAAKAPDDTYYANGGQWNVKKSRLTGLWETQRAGSPIAVIDDAVHTTHVDLTGRVVDTRDFTGTGFGPCGDHGTAVASVAAAVANNAKGLAGGAWSATVGSYDISKYQPTPGGQACAPYVAAADPAITAAVDDGYRILVASFGTSSPSLLSQQVYTDAWNRGAFISAAAGNDDSSAPFYPAAFANVFAVTNTDSSDARAPAPYGSWVDLAAPGENILAARGGASSYAYVSGSSYASPLVAAAAAILRAQGFTNSSIESRITSYGDPVDWDPTRTGEKRLNAYRAYEPEQGCIRDVPQGSWIYTDAGTRYLRTSSGLRAIPDGLSVVDSWRAGSDLMHVCDARLPDFSVDSVKVGYRPGRIVYYSATGFYYLITTDGADRTRPLKRKLIPPVPGVDVRQCYGWDAVPTISGSGEGMGQHANGPDIDTCNPLLRTFPNGSIVKSVTGLVYVIEGGMKRLVQPAAFNSWFATNEPVPATEAELAAIPNGSDWGMRPGRVTSFASAPTAYFAITDDGAERARGSQRPFEDALARTERFGSVLLSTAISDTVSLLHPQGTLLKNPDNMA